MPRAVCLTNVAHEGPGMLGELLSEAGYQVEVIEAFRGAALPENLGAKDILIVMGGPMGVADIGKAEFPWLAPVVELLRSRLAKDWPCVGVCLGMQLIAHAAGAKVSPMIDADGRRLREVGWGRLDFVGTDKITCGLPASIEVLHWHGDACELPRGASLLASTKICPVQMFQLGRSFGMQFHPEIDGPTACLWAEADAEFVQAANGPEGVAHLQAASVEAARRTYAHRRRLLSQALVAVTA
jgi:imidazoleglycerol phosphate synthase glutamine amidotransferase subunit HisH